MVGDAHVLSVADGSPDGQQASVSAGVREMGMSMGQLAERVGVSSNHMSEVSRGRKNMSPRVQSRVEAALDAPVKVDRRAGRRGPARPVGPDGSTWLQPERDGAAGRHQLRLSFSNHERPAKSVGGGSGEAARGPVPADGGGAGGPRRGEGAGVEEGRAQRRGGARRRRAWGAAAGLAAAPFAWAVACLGARRWSTSIAPGTTAGAGCR